MVLSALLALFAGGVLVGFLSGLIGIGGGVLIVPILYFFYGHSGWSGMEVPASLEAAVAHATSLFIIFPTAVRGVWSYHRSELVAWNVALPMAAGTVVAAALGAHLALLLPAELLKLAFGLLLAASAVQLVHSRNAAPAERTRYSWPWFLVGGISMGLLSALLGVGGGIVAIPFLLHIVGLDLPRVAATSLALVGFAAAAGFVSYILAGWGAGDLPTGSLGYVHLAAGVPVLLGALLSVRVGVRANQRVKSPVLRAGFALLLGVVGLRLIVMNAGALL